MRNCKTAITPPKDHPSTSPKTDRFTISFDATRNNPTFSYFE